MTPQLDLTNWLNDAEVCARLGVSPRWIDREAAAGRLHPLKRTRPGKRAERVCSPDEVEARMQRPAAELVRHEPVAPNAPPMSELAGLPPLSWEGIFAVVDEAVARVGERLLVSQAPPALWVSMKAAAQISGLSTTALRKLIDGGQLVALRDRAIKVRRESLADLDVAALAMRPVKKRGKR